VRGLTASATVAINDRSNELRRCGRDIFKLGLGQSPFPVPDVVVEALREHAGEKDYLPVQGLEALRKAVADHHRRTFRIDCDAEDVLIGPGSKELMFLLQLVFSGNLFIPTPTWVSYAPQARIVGRPVHLLTTKSPDNWTLLPSHLEQICETSAQRARLVILTYPSNPTGTCISSVHLKELAEIARRERVLLLSDEIYGKLHHTGEHRSIVPHYPEGTIFSGGLSKWCGAGGWRLGLFVFPKCLGWLREAMAAVASETFTSTCAPIQHAAICAFDGGPEIDHYLGDTRRVLRALGNLLTRRLRAAGADVRDPEGVSISFQISPVIVNDLQRKASPQAPNSANDCWTKPEWQFCPEALSASHRSSSPPESHMSISTDAKHSQPLQNARPAGLWMIPLANGIARVRSKR